MIYRTLIKNQQHHSFNKKLQIKAIFNYCDILLCCQDFCHGQVMWPPLSALQVKMAEPGQSCKQMCQEEQLICEPSFFQHLNKDKDLARYNTHTRIYAVIVVILKLTIRWQHRCSLPLSVSLFTGLNGHDNMTSVFSHIQIFMHKNFT